MRSMKPVVAPFVLALVLLVQSCGAEEATKEDVVSALCARIATCRMQEAPKVCPFQAGCSEPETWDARNAHRCVEAIAQAPCADLEISPVPTVPEVCGMNCH
jgi:hypothetical protein